MDKDSREWVEEAMNIAKRASERGVNVILCCPHDTNIVVTNSTGAGVIKGVAHFQEGFNTYDSD